MEWRAMRGRAELLTFCRPAYRNILGDVPVMERREKPHAGIGTL